MRVPAIIENLEGRRLLSGTLTTLTTLPSGTALGGVVVDSMGNIFGATQASAGTATGSLYELPAGATQITAFINSSPAPSLLADSAGDVFGDLPTGGTSGKGAVFELSESNQTYQILASYNGTDGSQLGNGVVRDLAGNIFVLAEPGSSTTATGAILKLPAQSSSQTTTPPPIGALATAAVTQQNSFTTLATFPSGAAPSGQLAIDAAGDIFAVSSTGGINSDGAIYELRAGSSTIVQIASFTPLDPMPQGDLIADARGDLFGTTYNAITSQQSLGTVYELHRGNLVPKTLIIDSSFSGSRIQPGLVRDSAGDIFGAIAQTSAASTVFEIPSGHSSIRTVGTAPQVLSSGTNINEINGYLGIDALGHIYGTTTASDGRTNDTLFALSNTTVPDTASAIKIATQPKTATASTPISSITVAAIDTNGNIVGSANSPISASISGSNNALLVGTLTVVPVNGIATFDNLIITSAGSHRLTFSQGTFFTQSASIKITPSPLDGSHLVITQAPASVTAGNKFSPIQVTAENTAGGVSTTTRGKVTLTFSATSGTQAQSLTKTASLKHGIATFKNISIKQADTYQLSAATPAAIAAQSVALTITPASVHKLTFTLQPALTVFAFSNFAVETTLSDRFGNTIIGNNSPVVLTLSGGSQSAILSGTLTRDSVDGVANFYGLSLNKPGFYRLIATDNAIGLHVTSTSVHVVPNPQSTGAN